MKIVLVAVKTYDTDAALAPLVNLKTESAFSVQNGVLKNDQLAAVFGAPATLGAIGLLVGKCCQPTATNPVRCAIRWRARSSLASAAGGTPIECRRWSMP